MSAGVLRGIYQRPECLTPRPWLACSPSVCYVRYASAVLFLLQVLALKCCFKCAKMRNGRIKKETKGKEETMVSKSNQPLCLPDLLPPVERKKK